MAEDRKSIGSIDELREQVPSILKKLNAEPSLVLAAAANPILALEELGYSIPGTLLRELELRIRFSREERGRLQKLEAKIFKAAGESFDIDDPVVLDRLLFTRLKLPPLPPEPVRLSIAQAPLESARPPSIGGHALAVRYRAPGSVRVPDVLAPLRDRHPVIEPLIAYRDITAARAPLAPRALYQRIRRGEVTGTRLKLRARIHRARAS